MQNSAILKIMDLALKQSPRPFERLERGKPVAEGRKAIAALSESELGAVHRKSFPLLQGALYLCFDCFEEAHTVANDHEGTVTGNWIHAILHRREPDAGNSKYWYARVKLPAKVSEGIAREVLALLKKTQVLELESLVKKMEKSKGWEPEAFVDVCEEFRKGDSKTTAYRMLAALQEIEWRALAETILS